MRLISVYFTEQAVSSMYRLSRVHPVTARIVQDLLGTMWGKRGKENFKNTDRTNMLVAEMLRKLAVRFKHDPEADFFVLAMLFAALMEH